MLYTLIIFVGLFIAGTTVAAIYYVKAEELRTRNDELQAQMDQLATRDEARTIPGIVGTRMPGQSNVGTLVEYLNDMVRLVKGTPVQVTSAEVKVSRKKTVLVEEDEGVTPTTAEGLAKLRPVEPGGVISFGAQTHPADGNCGFIVTTRDKAKDLSKDPNVEIQIVSYGFSRTKRGYMAAAPVPASEMALKDAGLKIEDMKAIKTHNPFIVNDINMAKKMGCDVMNMNNYGCSLVYGHPQSPTAGRLIAELLEELVILGGGYGLWAGCAAGDTAAAIIFKVS